MAIPLLKPSCTNEEIEAVAAVLKSGWWGQGPKCAEFEKKVAGYHGYKYCATVNSATAALHLSLLSLGIGPGDNVALPALTFVSTALAVKYVGANPVFVDVDPETLCMDWHKAREYTDIDAFIPVDFAGYPSQPGFENVPVIQDAAHSFGGQMCGDLVTFSFHPVKNLATGDGGAILTDDKDQYEHIKALRWCGIDKSTHERIANKYGWDYNINEIGYKYHWNDIQAAIGLVQLKRLDTLLQKRADIAAVYFDELEGVKGVQLPVNHPSHTWHLFAVRVDPNKRDKIIDYMLAKNISVGVHYKPLTHYPMFSGGGADLPVTEREWRRLISLPVFYDLSFDEVAYIADVFREAVRNV